MTTSTLMRSASDNILDNTSFPSSWATNSITGRASINAAEVISIMHLNKECNVRVHDEADEFSTGNQI